MIEQLLQYNIDFDQKEKDKQFISKQIETHLRERFNVLISTTEYGIVSGHLVRQGTDEPFIKSIKRGRDLIQRISQNPVDFDRENSEVIGFDNVIDPFMSDPKTHLGSKVLSISLRGDEGSKYKHNFYDIFTLKERNGKRYVKLSRYSSALTPRDYAERLNLDSKNPPKAAKLLEKPIIVTDPSVTPEQIHHILHKDHEYMEPCDFDEIWVAVQPFVNRYLANKDARSFNAILNFADEIWENKKRRESEQGYRDYMDYFPNANEIRRLEEKEVRQASGGCPGKSGVDINDSNYSVSEFGVFKDRGYDFDKEGICVVCNSGPKALGPCEICEECTIKIEKKEQWE